MNERNIDPFLWDIGMGWELRDFAKWLISDRVFTGKRLFETLQHSMFDNLSVNANWFISGQHDISDSLTFYTNQYQNSNQDLIFTVRI